MSTPPLPGTASPPSASGPDTRRLRTFLVVVDDTDEMRAALAFACKRARETGGQVALLRVIEPAGVQHFAFLQKTFDHETRGEAEQLLQRMAGEVNRRSGHIPSLYVREGHPVDELLALVQEEPSISVLVLAVGTGKRGPGPLVSAVGQGLSTRLRVPVTIVPGNLTEEEIENLM